MAIPAPMSTSTPAPNIPIRSDQRPEEAAHAGALPGADQERSQDGGEQAGGRHQDREQEDGGLEVRAYVVDAHHSLQGFELRLHGGAEGRLLQQEQRAGGGERDGGYDGADVGLKQVGAHAGHVSHVVPDVVGYGSGVPGVVLGYAGLYLAHEVGADVGGFGEDAAAHPGEQGYGGRAHAEAGDDAHVLEYPVEDGNADEADADHRDAHDGAAAEGHSEGRVEADLGLDGGAGVGPDRDAHADEPGEGGADGAGEVGYRGAGEGAVLASSYPIQDVVVDEQGQDDHYDDDEAGEEDVLPPEEGVGALLYGASYELNGLVALVLAQDVEREDESKTEAGDPCGDGEVEYGQRASP